jgi:hypothetical protein
MFTPLVHRSKDDQEVIANLPLGNNYFIGSRFEFAIQRESA